MSRTNSEVINLITAILQDHDDYWNSQMPELKRYKNSYENKFWSDHSFDKSMIRVETSDCFSYIEGFIAALFSKAPSVVLGTDIISPEADTEMAQEVVNRFLFNQREQLELASRLALIFTSSFIKLSVKESNNILSAVTVRACPPWEVIIDRDSTSWEGQRFVGHKYFLSIPEAQDKFGNKKFKAVPKKDYFKGSAVHKQADLPDEYMYIEVIELYDLSYDKLYFWSPNYKNGLELLSKSDIPVRTYDDKPLPVFAPLYYNRIPDKPLEGMSSIARVYDQFYEKNILRTYQANAVRRDSRQYIYKEGAFDEEALAKITAGIDGAMIAVDEQSLSGLIAEIPVTPISSNFNNYLAAIEADINRGSILAPFSRGESTRATATEITALAQYSASEIGKLARERDSTIEFISAIYLRILSLLVEEGDKSTIAVNGKMKVITTKDISGDFKATALDQGSTPLSTSLKQSTLMNLVPVLTSLGVDPTVIKEEIIRAFELPESLLKEPPKPPVAKGIPGSRVPDDAGTGPETQITDAQSLVETLGQV